MGKLLVVAFALCALVSCTDKESNKDDDHFSGSFASQKKQKVMMKQGFWNTISRDVVTEQVVLSVADGVYHEYKVTSEDGSSYELAEKVFRYKKRQDGSYDVIQVANECGEIKQSQAQQQKNQKIYKSVATKEGSKTMSGDSVKRITDEEFKKLVSDIEKNKKQDLYDYGCSTLWHWLAN